jgi:hypothetical protein
MDLQGKEGGRKVQRQETSLAGLTPNDVPLEPIV